MSLTPFAALDQRLNSAVLRHLANATAQQQGGQPFPVLFLREPVQPFGGAMDAAGHACSFDLAAAPNLAEGQRLTVNGTHYRVANGPVADASGWVNVVLYPEPPAPVPPPEPES
jgi:hypothetical protein